MNESKGIYGYKKITNTLFFRNVEMRSKIGGIHIKAQYPFWDCFNNGSPRIGLDSGQSAYIDTMGKILFTFEDDWF